MKDSELIQAVFSKNRASKKQCKDCVYYVENYKDDYTLRHFGYGEIKYRPACGYGKSYGYVSHNPAVGCKHFEVEKMNELQLTKCELNMAKAHIKFLNDKIKRRDFIISELQQKLRELKCANQLNKG